MAETTDKLALCRLRLSDCEIKIGQRAGIKHQAPDVLTVLKKKVKTKLYKTVKSQSLP